MKLNLLLTGLAAAALAVPAGADSLTINYPARPNPDPQVTDLPHVGEPLFWDVQQFNPGPGQILQSVSVSLNEFTSFSLQNQGGSPATFGMNPKIAFHINVNGSDNANILHLSLPDKLLAPGEFYEDPVVDPLGTSMNFTKTWDAIAPGDQPTVDWFTGPGTVNIPLSVIFDSVNYTPGGTGGGNALFHTYGQASLDVTYNFSNVPEPSFYGAMGALVCFGLLGYRQYRAKQNA